MAVRVGGVVVNGVVDLDALPLRLRLSLPIPEDGPPADPALVAMALDRVRMAADDVAIEQRTLRVVGWLEASAVVDLAACVHVLQGLSGASSEALARYAPKGALHQCPACQGDLRVGVGSQGQDVCAACHGHFFGPSLSGPLIQSRFSLSPADVARDAVGLAGTRAHCQQGMRPAVIGETIIDVCPGCGAIWLDAGETDAFFA